MPVSAAAAAGRGDREGWPLVHREEDVREREVE